MLLMLIMLMAPMRVKGVQCIAWSQAAWVIGHCFRVVAIAASVLVQSLAMRSERAQLHYTQAT